MFFVIQAQLSRGFHLATDIPGLMTAADYTRSFLSLGF